MTIHAFVRTLLGFIKFFWDGRNLPWVVELTLLALCLSRMLWPGFAESTWVYRVYLSWPNLPGFALSNWVRSIYLGSLNLPGFASIFLGLLYLPGFALIYLGSLNLFYYVLLCGVSSRWVRTAKADELLFSMKEGERFGVLICLSSQGWLASFFSWKDMLYQAHVWCSNHVNIKERNVRKNPQKLSCEQSFLQPLRILFFFFFQK